MAILNFEGFESIGTETGLANHAITSPRLEKRFEIQQDPDHESFLRPDFVDEGFAWQMGEHPQSNTNWIRWNLPEEHQDDTGDTSTIYTVGARVHIPQAGETFSACRLACTNGRRFEVRVFEGTDIQIIRAFSTVLDSVADVLTPESWVYMESRLRASKDSQGFYEVRLNGVVVLTGFASTILGPSDETTLRIFFGNSSNNNTGEGYVAYDDMYFTTDQQGPNTDYLSHTVRVRNLGIKDDGSPQQWVPSQASPHHQLIDENGADASDYVETFKDEKFEMFQVNGLPKNGKILCLKTEAEALNLTGGPATLQVRAHSASLVEEAHTPDNTDDFEVFELIAENDPAGGEWENEVIEDLQVGVKLEVD